MKKAISLIVSLLAIAALVAGIVLIYRYTNGFNEDFKTFYIERDGEKILAGKSSASFTPGEEVRYDVGYTFDLPQKEPREYNVEILPNPDADFEFTVGEIPLAWRRAEGLQKCFSLEKYEDHFTLHIPTHQNVEDYLSEVYGEDVQVKYDSISAVDIPFFLLRVSSYNNTVIFNVTFSVTPLGFKHVSHSVMLDPSVFGTYCVRGYIVQKKADETEEDPTYEFLADFPCSVLDDGQIIFALNKPAFSPDIPQIDLSACVYLRTSRGDEKLEALDISSGSMGAATYYYSFTMPDEDATIVIKGE